MYKVLFLLILSLPCFGQNCKMLEDGKYELLYDSINQDSTFFEINKDKYSTNLNGEIKDFEIKILSNCSFRLKSNEVVDESKLTEFQKVISKQSFYYEITKVEGNVYYFKCKVNLHVQCGTGRFIKIE